MATTTSRRIYTAMGTYLNDRRMATRNSARSEVERMAVIMARQFREDNRHFSADLWYSAVGMSAADVRARELEIDQRGYFKPTNVYTPLHLSAPMVDTVRPGQTGAQGASYCALRARRLAIRLAHSLHA